MNALAMDRYATAGGEGGGTAWPKPRKRPLPGMHPDYPVKNLVMEGGGARGLGYCGALLELEALGKTDSQPGVLDFVSRFAGASAGAIVAMNLALGYSAAEIDRMATEANMEEEVQDAKLCCGVMQLLDLCCCWCSKGRLGIFPGKRLLKFIGDTIAARTGDPLTTFKELYDETGVELCIVVCNLTCMVTEEWHVKTTPNKPIREAVRASMGVPVGLQPLMVEGGQGSQMAFVDGGTLSNFPIHVFDGWWLSMQEEDSFRRRVVDAFETGKHCEDLYARSDRFGTKNWTTLGLCLVSEGDVSRFSRWKQMKATRHEDDRREIQPLDNGRGQCKIGEYTVTDVTAVDRPAAELTRMPVPDTKLGKKHKEKDANKQKMPHSRQPNDHAEHPYSTSESSALARLRKGVRSADTNGDGTLSPSELRKLLLKLNDESNHNPSELRLLGVEDIAAVVKMMDKDDSGTIEIKEFEAWLAAEADDIEARNYIENFARFRQVAPSKMSGLGSLLGNLVNGYMQMSEYVNTTTDDIARTVPIETGYITVTDFETEAADKQYLRDQGHRAIKQFASDLLEAREGTANHTSSQDGSPKSPTTLAPTDSPTPALLPGAIGP